MRKKRRTRDCWIFLVELIQTGENGRSSSCPIVPPSWCCIRKQFDVIGHFFDAVLNNSQGRGALLWHCSEGGPGGHGRGIPACGRWAYHGTGDPGRLSLLTDRYLEKNLNRMIAHRAETVPDEKVLNGVRIMNTARELPEPGCGREVDRHYGSMDVFFAGGTWPWRGRKRNYRKTTWNGAGEHIFFI